MRTSILLAMGLAACQPDTDGPPDGVDPLDTELARCAAEDGFGLLWQVNNQHGEILAIEVLQSGVVALTSEDRSVKRWMIGADATGTPTESGNPVYGISFPDAGAPVRSLAMDEGGRALIGGDDDGNVLVWDLSDLSLADSTDLPGDALQTVAVDPDTGTIAWGTWAFGGGMRTWDRDGEPSEVLQSALWGVSEVVFLPGGDLFTVGDWYGVAAWERWTPGASQPSLYWQSPENTDGWAYTADVTVDGDVVVGGLRYVTVVDPDSAEPVTWVDLDLDRSIDRLAASPVDGLFATVERAGTLSLWDGDAEVLAAVAVDSPVDVGWGPSGQRVIVATEDGMLQAWGCTE